MHSYQVSKKGLILVKIIKRLFVSMLALVLVVTSLVFTPHAELEVEAAATALEKFNIVMFWPYHWEEELCDDYFDDLKNAGFTTIEMNSSMNADVLTYENNLKAIELAYERGLNITVSEKDYNNSTWPEKTDAEIEAFVNRYIDVPGVTGIYIEDEDGNAKRYASAIAKIKSMWPDVVCHVNFCNDYADVARGLYNELAKYGTGLMDYLMYDKYTFITPICDEQTFYHYLEYNRVLGQELGLPTANYIQSMEINGGYRPNGDDIRYQIWAGLAYGLKQISYFCYHEPPASDKETFGPALIDMNGNKTDLYEPSSEINWNVQTIGDTLMKLTANEIYHTGTNFGTAYNALPSSHYLQPVDSTQDLTISRMTHQNGDKYGILVNRDYNYEQTVEFTLNGMQSIHRISTETGEPELLVPDANGVYSVDLKAGEGFLYRVGNSADYYHLGAAVDTAEAINLNKYTATGKANFQTALKAAKTVENNLNATQSSINTALTNLQVAQGALTMTIASTANLALNRPVTATHSLEGSGYGKSYLTDGVLSSSSNYGWSVDPASGLAKDDSVDIIIELADNYWVEGVVLKPVLNDSGASFPMDYTIDVSTDNKTWKTLGKGSGIDLTSAINQHYAHDGIKGKYVRIRITNHSDIVGQSGGYISRIGEIEVYGVEDVTFGDMNDDTSITASDAQYVLQAVVGKITLSEMEVFKADVDGDGVITAGDALDVLKKAVGRIKKFAVDR